MKILYHHRTRSKDGQNVHIEELTAALRRQGHEIIIVSPTESDDSEFGSNSGFVDILKSYLPKAIYELIEFTYAVVAYNKLKKAVEVHKPDVLYERYNLFLLAGVRLARRKKLPYLLEVNAPMLEERAKFEGISLKYFAAWTERTAWLAADFVLPVTDCLADHLRAAGVSDKKIKVIPNGINLDRFENRNGNNKKRKTLKLTGKTVLGFTGFMREWHGLERVIDVMAAAPNREDLHFLVVGDGPARKSLEDYAASLGLEKQITLTGVVGRDEIADFVSVFDIALQPQVVEYASPLKLFEYMALGRAIVAPDQRNIREILVHEENALLFDPASADDFSESIKRLIGDENLRQSLGENAISAIHDGGLTWDSNAERVVTLFTSLLAQEK